MKKKEKSGTVRPRSIETLRTELAAKIAFLTSAAEPRVVIEPGILLARQVAPSAPCMNTYEPSVIIVAQGAKRVDLGNREFVYDRSRYLLTAIDLPLVSQVVEASEAVPMLAMKMKLDLPVVRELLSREEVHVNAVAGEGAGLVTGEITPELLGAFIRLLDLAETPQHMPFLSGLIQREVIYRILSGPEGARFASDRHVGRSKSTHRQGNRLDQRQLRQTIASGRVGRDGRHGCFHLSSPFPCAHAHEPGSVPEAA